MLIPVLHHGESHSPVVHELWVLVVAGSNPASPTERKGKGKVLKTFATRARGRFPLVAREACDCGVKVRRRGVHVALRHVELRVARQ